MNPKVQDPPSAGSEASAFTAEAVATDSDSLRDKLAEQTELKLRLTVSGNAAKASLAHVNGSCLAGTLPSRNSSAHTATIGW
jgi:hypothetical protein